VGRILADVTPLRRHRDFRRLWIGQLVSFLGSQLTIVGVAVQAYRLTHSTLVVGLTSLGQLGPLLIASLVGGSIADAMDRRRLLLVTQVLFAIASGGLLLNASLPHPALWPLFVCTACAAAVQGVDWPARKAALPMLVPLEDLPSSLALWQIQMQIGAVAGPALAGLLIAKIGLPVVFGIDAASFGAAFAAILLLPALVPAGGGTPAGLSSIKEGMHYLRRERLLASTFLIDIDAMVFGMPRAVFPALGTGLFGGGAGTVGLLYSAPAVGALLGALSSGWISRVHRQGRAVIVAVTIWGAAIAGFGVVPILSVGLLLLAIAGAADVVSAVFRNAILQMTVPEHLQGRLSGTFIAVVTGGPRLGDAEAGAAAAIGGAQFAVWSGGLACVAGVAALAWRFPELWRHTAPVTAAPLEPLAELSRLGEE
jgi:MFS family permease